MNGQGQFIPPNSETNILKFQPNACERSSGEMSEVTKKSEKVTSLDVDFRSDSFICSIMLVSVTERELGY